MKLSSVLELYSNIHKKPRQLKGTKLFFYRYYFVGGMIGFGAATFFLIYLSPLYGLTLDFVKRHQNNEAEERAALYSIMGLVPKSSQELQKEILIAQKVKDFTS